MAYIVEREFEHAGYKCVVIFTNMGYRCGYVGVPKESKLYRKDYEKIDLYVHGGLTYSGGGKNSDYPVESDLWWFGFDCYHTGDRKDYEYTMKLFPQEEKRCKDLMRIEREVYGKDGNTDEVIRSEEYVAEECKRLAEQIKEYEMR